MRKGKREHECTERHEMGWAGARHEEGAKAAEPCVEKHLIVHRTAQCLENALANHDQHLKCGDM